MLFSRAIKRQQTAVAVKLSETQRAMHQVDSDAAATDEITDNAKIQPLSGQISQGGRPARLLGFSFIAGAVLGCIFRHSPSGSTAKTLGQVSRGIRTSVAAVALAKTVHELTQESTRSQH